VSIKKEVMLRASGLPEELVKACIDFGVGKFNVNTEVRSAYMNALRTTQEGLDRCDVLCKGIHASCYCKEDAHFWLNRDVPQGPAVLKHSCLFQMRGIISSHLKKDDGSMKNEKPLKFSVPKKKRDG
jgi:hypothetical protein